MHTTTHSPRAASGTDDSKGIALREPTPVGVASAITVSVHPTSTYTHHGGRKPVISMNSLQIIETARGHWDEETVSEHGFDAFPGDAVLRHGAPADDPGQYRIVQFLDIITPTDAPQATHGLVAEYIATETDRPATYEILAEVDTTSLTPDVVNHLLDETHDRHIYSLERTESDLFELEIP